MTVLICSHHATLLSLRHANFNDGKVTSNTIHVDFFFGVGGAGCNFLFCELKIIDRQTCNKETDLHAYKLMGCKLMFMALPLFFIVN